MSALAAKVIDGHVAAATHDANTTAAWVMEAEADLTAPLPRQRLQAALRWAQRAAMSKAAQVVAERRLSQLYGRERDAHLRALGCGISAWEEAILRDAPSPVELRSAESDLSEATIALELAERIARLLERPRRTVAPISGQAGGKPGFGRKP